MTLTQFVDYVRNRHNASGDSNWSDSEIYSLITGRCNEVLSIIGLIEGTDTSTTTVASTQAYSLPSNTITIKALLYNGELLQPISFKEWEEEKSSGSTPTGTPKTYVVWNSQVLLIPTPDAANTLTFYIEKLHPLIDGSAQSTIDLPAVLHYRLADGVICDMAAKDMNQQMMTFYEQKWNQAHIPSFYRYAFLRKRRGRMRVVKDADTSINTDYGVI